jgi:hypothetical protein
LGSESQKNLFLVVHFFQKKVKKLNNFWKVRFRPPWCSTNRKAKRSGKGVSSLALAMSPQNQKKVGVSPLVCESGTGKPEPGTNFTDSIFLHVLLNANEWSKVKLRSQISYFHSKWFYNKVNFYINNKLQVAYSFIYWSRAYF